MFKDAEYWMHESVSFIKQKKPKWENVQSLRATETDGWEVRGREEKKENSSHKSSVKSKRMAA